jgi:predicted DNA-binding antitoxin AbrB/MazE fold protein
MSQQIDAIYDNGVLKPLVPLELPDKTRVKITLEPEQESASTAKLAEQKAALRKLWQELDQLPQTHNNDGWSVRQHDQLLYGEVNDLR